MPGTEKNRDAGYYAQGVMRGDVALLGRSITLMESELPRHRRLALEILSLLDQETRSTFRLGITGVPGVGKSTFIESFGMHLIAQGHRIAVLAVDPSSVKSRGSILGDKTRMSRLAAHNDAFVRPSPSAGTLGGLGRATYGTIRLCEAAGYDFVIVETVGVGQSEIAVSGVTDCMLLLMLAGAGDELQGIKRGIMEVADLVAITKADGGNEKKAAAARAEFARALHLFQPGAGGWQPPVLTCSALTGEGISRVFDTVADFRKKMEAGGHFEARRRAQQLQVLEEVVNEAVLRQFYSRNGVGEQIKALKRSGQAINPFQLAAELLQKGGFQP